MITGIYIPPLDREIYRFQAENVFTTPYLTHKENFDTAKIPTYGWHFY